MSAWRSKENIEHAASFMVLWYVMYTCINHNFFEYCFGNVQDFINHFHVFHKLCYIFVIICEYFCLIYCLMRNMQDPRCITDHLPIGPEENNKCSFMDSW